MPSRPIDLRLNYPLLEGQSAALHEVLQRSSPDEIEAAVCLPPYEGLQALRHTAAEWLSRPGYPLSPDQIVTTTGGHQALLVSMLATRMSGGAVAVDPLTYPGIIALARVLQFSLVPCESDSAGMLPAALEQACRKLALKAVYLMPTIHNPLGTVMPVERRLELLRVARQHGLWMIEDDAYGFLDASAFPSFAHLAPDISFYIYSLTKPIAPGIRTAFLHVPDRFFDAASEALRLSSGGAVPLLGSIVRRWMCDGTLAGWIRAKREEAVRRQAIARDTLAGLNLVAHPTSYHLWLTLPAGLAACHLLEMLSARQVSAGPASVYTVAPFPPPEALRLALGGERDLGRLAQGLAEVAACIRSAM